MSAISALDYPTFESWVIKTYPRLFDEWETEASEFIEIDEWLEREHSEVLDTWRKARPMRKRLEKEGG